MSGPWPSRARPRPSWSPRSRNWAGRPIVVEGYLTRPDEAIAKLGPIDDPLIGVFVHWTYAPHTVDGVVGKDNPLLLASNFSGTWPGLVALLNTGASLESVGRAASRIWTDAPDWTADAAFMERLDEWCSTGQIRYPTNELHGAGAIRPEAIALAAQVEEGIRRSRVLALMLGDTSMGMINGYFGPRLLYPIGFSRAQGRPGLADRADQDGQRPARRRRLPVRPGPGRHLPLAGSTTPRDFTAEATREQLRGYLAVLDLLGEFKADCLGWQYQLGLLKLLPPSDFAEGLLNSHAGPKATATSSSPAPRPTRATSCRWS